MTERPLEVRALPLQRASVKRSQVELIVARTARAHAAADFTFNLAGLLPIPGGGLVGAASSIAAQVPLFYQPMVSKIAAAYLRDVDPELHQLVREAAWLGADLDIATEFGLAFLGDVIGEMLVELGFGWTLTKLIPILGPLLSGGLDAVIASTLTWRVGVAAAIYYENGLAWVGGSQKATYAQAKTLVGGFDVKAKRVDLEALRQRIPEVNSSTIRTTLELVKLLRKHSIPLAQIRRQLCDERGLDSDIVEAALRDLRSPS